jgi:hypothetical protein
MKRLDFIKSLGTLAGVALTPKSKPEKLTLPNHTSNADMSIGVNGVERMRVRSDGTYLFIQSSDNVGMSITNPNTKLKFK